MAFTIKIRTQPGAPMVCEYECLNPEHEDCGLFTATVKRDENGNPPEVISCEVCSGAAELVISAPSIKFWSRDPVPIGYASKSDEKDPRALDTEPLATGKMTKPEWKKWQRDLRTERRYQRRLKAGKISKRIQVGGG